MLAALANAKMRLGDFEACADYATQAVDAARVGGGEAPVADATVSLGVALCQLRRGEEGLEAIRDGLEQARRIGDRAIAMRAYINLSDALEGRCRHAEAADVAREGLRFAEEYGAIRIISAYLSGNLAEPLLRLGEWDEAEQIASTAIADGRERFFASTLLELLAQLALFQGDLELATGAAAGGARRAGRRRGSTVHPPARLHRRGAGAQRRRPGPRAVRRRGGLRRSHRHLAPLPVAASLGGRSVPG